MMDVHNIKIKNQKLKKNKKKRRKNTKKSKNKQTLKSLMSIWPHLFSDLKTT